MLELNNITLARGQKVLLDGASTQIYSGDRIGLIGRNGTGKSSLFALFRGEVREEQGEVVRARNLRIASLRQEFEPNALTALEYVIEGDEEYHQLMEALHKAEEALDSDKIVQIHEALYAIDGYSTPRRAEEILQGLGFPLETQSLPTKSFSGGWQMRLNLARALMKPCDLLLLDEPTNHLDLDAIVFLEKWLKSFAGTFIIIAHDSYFLDQVVDKILWVHEQKLVLKKGNYTKFLAWRAEELALQQKHFIAQQKKVEKLTSFINRFRAKATKAKQAQSRVKALEKMELVAQVQEEGGYDFEIVGREDCPDPVIRMRKVALGYPEKTVLKGVNVYLGPRDRIGLLGVNGAGKSTLIKALSGELAPLENGDSMRANNLVVGYFAQHQVERLHLESSALWHVKQLAPPNTMDVVLRTFLGSFHFTGDMATTPVGDFSGGEKARLALALIAYSKPHLLLLDEPTNHLDLDMREALTIALQSFSGAVVVVSHDRQLLESVVDKYWLVADGKVTPYDETLATYQAKILSGK